MKMIPVQSCKPMDCKNSGLIYIKKNHTEIGCLLSHNFFDENYPEIPEWCELKDYNEQIIPIT